MGPGRLFTGQRLQKWFNTTDGTNGCLYKWWYSQIVRIYLGHSLCHARTVALVLNLKIGLISPQFHVVYDNEFNTVNYLSSAPPPHLQTGCISYASRRNITTIWTTGFTKHGSVQTPSRATHRQTTNPHPTKRAKHPRTRWRKPNQLLHPQKNLTRFIVRTKVRGRQLRRILHLSSS